MLRSDCTIFDEYVRLFCIRYDKFLQRCDHEEIRFPVHCTLFYAQNDKRISPELLRSWGRHFPVGDDMPMIKLEGHHLAPLYDPIVRGKWFQDISDLSIPYKKEISV